MEGLGRKVKVVITERSRGLASWVRFGEEGLKTLLKGFDLCCKERVPESWNLQWHEGALCVTNAFEKKMNKLVCRPNC